MVVAVFRLHSRMFPPVYSSQSTRLVATETSQMPLPVLVDVAAGPRPAETPCSLRSGFQSSTWSQSRAVAATANAIDACVSARSVIGAARVWVRPGALTAPAAAVASSSQSNSQEEHLTHRRER